MGRSWSSPFSVSQKCELLNPVFFFFKSQIGFLSSLSAELVSFNLNCFTVG